MAVRRTAVSGCKRNRNSHAPFNGFPTSIARQGTRHPGRGRASHTENADQGSSRAILHYPGVRPGPGAGVSAKEACDSSTTPVSSTISTTRQQYPSVSTPWEACGANAVDYINNASCTSSRDLTCCRNAVLYLSWSFRYHKQGRASVKWHTHGLRREKRDREGMEYDHGKAILDPARSLQVCIYGGVVTGWDAHCLSRVG